MPKITVTVEDNEIVLLDTDNINLGNSSLYFKQLVEYKKLDEAFEILSHIDDSVYWRAGILLKNLKRKQLEEREDSITTLMSKSSLFHLSHQSNSAQIATMANLTCYRVGADAGAGFKMGDLDILGTEGLLECVAILVHTQDTNDNDCFYLGHLYSARETESAVREELDKVIRDIRQLTDRHLVWSDLKGQVTLVGIGNTTDEPSKCYKQTCKILHNEKANPSLLFGTSVAFNLIGHGDLIILQPKGRLIQGIESNIPRVGHGLYSPCDLVSKISGSKPATLEEQIHEQIESGIYPYIEKNDTVLSTTKI